MAIVYTDGLSEAEFLEIERVYQIKLPKEFKSFYSHSLPISVGFYNWRDFSENNVSQIKLLMRKVKQDIIKDIDDIDWNDDWGQEPEDIGARNKIIMDRLEQAPNLIPIYGHRYIAELNTEKSPVISAVGSDVIYYAYDLNGYLSGERVPYGALLSDFTYIPFWTDIM